MAVLLSPFRKSSRLHRTDEKAKAKRTILLDYNRDWFPFVDSYHAFRNEHYLISACTVVRWFFTAIGPLAAAIISVGSVSLSQNINVITSTKFDEYQNETSARLAMDSTSAILLNGASHILGRRRCTLSPLSWRSQAFPATSLRTQTRTPELWTAFQLT